MRPSPSAWPEARAGVTAHALRARRGMGLAMRAGSRRRVAGLLAAFAPMAALSLGASMPASGRSGPTAAGASRAGVAPTGASRAGASAGAPVPAGGLYRVVGCRSGADRVAYRHGPARREVAIGFDDGPWTLTAEFVGMLERSGARATFFMIGRQVLPADRGTLLRELRAGDALGDHSFTHPELTRLADPRAQLGQTIAAIRSLTGYTPCVFRPPYGAYDPAVISAARSLGLATVLWNVDPADWSQPGTAAIERRVLEQVQPGSIIISHDGGGQRSQTLAAYPAIIAALRRRGYTIVTIPELLGFRPLYVPCVKLCEAIGIPRSQLPRDAVIERAP